MTKVCSKCKAEQPLTSFAVQPCGFKGVRADCKICRKEYDTNYRVEHKEKYLATQKKSREKRKDKVALWRKENKIKRKEYQIAWNKANPDKLRAQKYRNRYGIDLSDYEDLLAKQEGKCAICGVTRPGRGRDYLYVDHCHNTGAVRGLLCGNCNSGLGHFNDNPDYLDQASKYLKDMT